MARQAIRAPEQQPPRYGLLAAAPPANALASERWQNGWEFTRMPCHPGSATAVNCGSDNAARSLAFQEGGTLVVGDPIEIWAARRCTLRGFATAEYESRARQMLASIASFYLARELWTGEIRDSVGDPDLIDNMALTDIGSDTVTNGPVDPHVALALLVGALGDCNDGGRGMIHVTPEMLQTLIFEGSVYRDGNTWLSAMGHIVVADDGYDGSGPGGVPAAGSQWAYATTMVSTVQSEVNVPGSMTESGGWVDRKTNTVTVYADQLAGFMLDGCCHVAAEVDLAAPLIDGAS